MVLCKNLLYQKQKKIGPNPTDRGKQGVKRSILCDGNGIPLSIEIDGANRHDIKLLEPTLQNLQIERPKSGKENICLDKAYDSQEVRQLLECMEFEPHIRSRGEEKREKLNNPNFQARRWVVERTHSWLNQFRRIFIRWERKEENYLAMLYLACAIIVWRNTGLLG